MGRIPIDPHFVECVGAGGPFLEKHPESEVAEACNLIIKKLMGGERKWSGQPKNLKVVKKRHQKKGGDKYAKRR